MPTIMNQSQEKKKITSLYLPTSYISLPPTIIFLFAAFAQRRRGHIKQRRIREHIWSCNNNATLSQTNWALFSLTQRIWGSFVSEWTPSALIWPWSGVDTTVKSSPDTITYIAHLNTTKCFPVKVYQFKKNLNTRIISLQILEKTVGQMQVRSDPELFERSLIVSHCCSEWGVL